jgi:hypothetical protein
MARKGLSQDGGRGDFSKTFRTSLFNKYLAYLKISKCASVTRNGSLELSISLAKNYIILQKIVVFLEKILNIKILHFQVDNIFTGSVEI